MQVVSTAEIQQKCLQGYGKLERQRRNIHVKKPAQFHKQALQVLL